MNKSVEELQHYIKTLEIAIAIYVREDTCTDFDNDEDAVGWFLRHYADHNFD